jgi:hypothetical protein
MFRVTLKSSLIATALLCFTGCSTVSQSKKPAPTQKPVTPEPEVCLHQTTKRGVFSTALQQALSKNNFVFWGDTHESITSLERLKDELCRQPQTPGVLFLEMLPTNKQHLLNDYLSRAEGSDAALRAHFTEEKSVGNGLVITWNRASGMADAYMDILEVARDKKMLLVAVDDSKALCIINDDKKAEKCRIAVNPYWAKEIAGFLKVHADIKTALLLGGSAHSGVIKNLEKQGIIAKFFNISSPGYKLVDRVDNPEIFTESVLPNGTVTLPLSFNTKEYFLPLRSLRERCTKTTDTITFIPGQNPTPIETKLNRYYNAGDFERFEVTNDALFLLRVSDRVRKNQKIGLQLPTKLPTNAAFTENERNGEVACMLYLNQLKEKQPK